MTRLCAVTAALFTLGGCGEAPNVDRIDTDLLFSGAVTSMVFEVDYASEAIPRVVTLCEGQPIWSIFRSNVERVFEGKNKTFVFPESLDDMTDIGSFPDESYTIGRIQELAEEHRNQHIEGAQVAIYVLFLNGWFHDGTQERPEVLGASLGETGIIAMFYPSIMATAEGGPQVPTFVQAATLTHEFGHAIGLVNRAVGLQSEHHDAEHGHHCANEHCVMHYTNEGAAGMRQFIDRLQSREGSAIIFGPDCLVDARVLAGLDSTLPPDETTSACQGQGPGGGAGTGVDGPPDGGPGGGAGPGDDGPPGGGPRGDGPPGAGPGDDGLPGGGGAE